MEAAPAAIPALQPYHAGRSSPLAAGNPQSLPPALLEGVGWCGRDRSNREDNGV